MSSNKKLRIVNMDDSVPYHTQENTSSGKMKLGEFNKFNCSVSGDMRTRIIPNMANKDLRFRNPCTDLISSPLSELTGKRILLPGPSDECCSERKPKLTQHNLAASRLESESNLKELNTKENNSNSVSHCIGSNEISSSLSSSVSIVPPHRKRKLSRNSDKIKMAKIRIEASNRVRYCDDGDEYSQHKKNLQDGRLGSTNLSEQGAEPKCAVCRNALSNGVPRVPPSSLPVIQIRKDPLVERQVTRAQASEIMMSTMSKLMYTAKKSEDASPNEMFGRSHEVYLPEFGPKKTDPPPVSNNASGTTSAPLLSQFFPASSVVSLPTSSSMITTSTILPIPISAPAVATTTFSPTSVTGPGFLGNFNAPLVSSISTNPVSNPQQTTTPCQVSLFSNLKPNLNFGIQAPGCPTGSIVLANLTSTQPCQSVATTNSVTGTYFQFSAPQTSAGAPSSVTQSVTSMASPPISTAETKPPVFSVGSQQPLFTMGTTASLFESKNPPSFGMAAMTQNPPSFSTPTTVSLSTPSFGTSNTVAQNPPAFGVPTTEVARSPAFGSTVLPTPIFGSSLTGIKSAPIFGASTSGNLNILPFTAPSSTTKNPPAFGSNSESLPKAPTFGGSTSGPQNLPFGVPNSQKASIFGPSTSGLQNPPPAFGSAPVVQSQPPVFGAPPVTQAQTSLFGGPPVTQTQPPVFGAPPVTQTQPPVFGAPPVTQTQPPVFGAPPVTQTQPPVFGAPPVTQTQPPVFGAPPVTQTQPPIFGAMAVTQSQPIFGAPATQSQSVFGTPSVTQNQGAFGAPGKASFAFSNGQMPKFGMSNNTSEPQKSVASAPTIFSAPTTKPGGFAFNLSASASSFGTNISSIFGQNSFASAPSNSIPGSSGGPLFSRAFPLMGGNTSFNSTSSGSIFGSPPVSNSTFTYADNPASPQSFGFSTAPSNPPKTFQFGQQTTVPTFTSPAAPNFSSPASTFQFSSPPQPVSGQMFSIGTGGTSTKMGRDHRKRR